jgi:hypothetical protein
MHKISIFSAALILIAVAAGAATPARQVAALTSDAAEASQTFTNAI